MSRTSNWLHRQFSQGDGHCSLVIIDEDSEGEENSEAASFRFYQQNNQLSEDVFEKAHDLEVE